VLKRTNAPILNKILRLCCAIALPFSAQAKYWYNKAFKQGHASAEFFLKQINDKTANDKKTDGDLRTFTLLFFVVLFLVLY
jgi:TPR repeat protein